MTGQTTSARTEGVRPAFAMTRAMHDLWLKLRGNRLFPERSDFSFRTIPGCHEMMWIVQVPKTADPITGDLNFRHVLSGSRCEDISHARMQGRALSEIDEIDPTVRQQWTRLFTEVVRQKTPTWFFYKPAHHSNLKGRTEILLAPLGRDRVEHILGCFDYEYGKDVLALHMNQPQPLSLF